jgi:lipopolysaccharide/colanic/teichoic acid biosynthesis glycosyltransferase
VHYYPTDLRALVLSVRPGITDRASIEYKDENQLLASSDTPEKTYVDVIIPVKLQFYAAYVRDRTFFGDLKILLDTAKAVFLR